MRISKFKSLRWRLIKKPIGLVFSHEYNLSLAARDTHKTFDSMKYKKIRDLLIAKNLLSRKKILIPKYVSYQDLELVHTPAFLKNIGDRKIRHESDAIDYIKCKFMKSYEEYEIGRAHV